MPLPFSILELGSVAPHTNRPVINFLTMRRLWLIFAEFVAITLAVVFVITLIRPDWNPWRRNVVEIRETGSPTGSLVPIGNAPTMRASYAEAAKRAMQSVVNISSSREVRAQRHPLVNDPLLRRFLGQTEEPDDSTETSLHLG